MDVAAIPAYPHKIAISVNGKTVYIRLIGDEKVKRAESEDGYTIIQNDKNEWCYAQLKADSTIQASPWLIGVHQTNNQDFKNFLIKTPKHLKPKTKPKPSPRHTRIQAPKVEGQRKVLIILMEYKDLRYIKTKNDFEKLFNEEGYHEDNAQGSVRDFYLSASYHQLELISDIYGPYITEHEMSYYGKNSSTNNGQDVNAYELFVEAITHVSADTDLRQYDGDGDGFIDNVHIIFAGYGEEAGAASNAIWSHEATFYRPYEIGGVKIDKYSCAPELRGNSGGGISRIGPHCHEIGHALGAMDFYDTDYRTGGEYEGTGKWDVMASGSWNNDGISPADFNPYVKAYNYGWITPKALPAGSVTMAPSCDSPDDYYILKASEYGDYYLLENRSREKWGAGVPGEGLLVFHIHADIENAGNEINATAPQKCYVVCASSSSRIPTNNPSSYGNINSDGCPYPGRSNNQDFGRSSTPLAFYWSEDECGIELNGITLQSNGDITLINNSTNSDYVPTPMKTLFFEGFEESLYVSLGQGAFPWQVVMNPENTQSITNRPIAYEGVRCLQLSARESSQDATNSIEFECVPENSTGKIRLKIYTNSMFLNFNKPNIVKVGYLIDGETDWQYKEIKSSDNSKWILSYVDIPMGARIKVKMDCTTFKGSILSLDNIEVEQEVISDVMKIWHPSTNNSQTEAYFTLDGIRLKEPIHGMNILRMSDGKCRKVWIK